jgi:hypothetical protein
VVVVVDFDVNGDLDVGVIRRPSRASTLNDPVHVAVAVNDHVNDNVDGFPRRLLVPWIFDSFENHSW